MRSIHTFAQLVLVSACFASPALAQKKALTQTDWDWWRSIQSATLSNDGKWIAYTLAPQVGDGEFVVRSTTGPTEYRVPVGYISRPNNIPGGLRARGGGAGGGRGGGGGRAGGGGASGPFTADSRYAFVSVQPTKEEVERQERAAPARGGRAGRGGAGGGETASPRNHIVMVNLADGSLTPMPTVRTYRLPEASGKWMVYTAAPDSATPDSATRSETSAGRGGRSGTAPSRPRRTYGTPITLRNLDTGADEVIADVVAYQFDDSAKVLAYTVASRTDSTRNGVYLRNLVSGATIGRLLVATTVLAAMSPAISQEFPSLSGAVSSGGGEVWSGGDPGGAIAGSSLAGEYLEPIPANGNELGAVYPGDACSS